MKIERLLGIIIYLLNREIVSANTLAERFEVSTRTIQRDIEAINIAGIPVTSIQGSNGGYGILDSFRLDKHVSSKEDYQFIITALKSMNSAYNSKKLEATLEKLLNTSNKERFQETKVRLDFSVSREGRSINQYLKTIEEASNEKKVIELEYSNSYGNITLREVEPVGLIYKWYAWYMFGYCRSRQDYRLFKVARIRSLRKLDKSFSIEHDSFEILLAEYEKQDSRECLHVKLLCKKEILMSIEEYFPKASIEAVEDGEFTVQFHVPGNEIGWKGLIYTYGNKIKIVEPEELKLEFMSKAQEIINNYK
jgi:predicted DNA-binding transcriptional regulator YafY